MPGRLTTRPVRAATAILAAGMLLVSAACSPDARAGAEKPPGPGTLITSRPLSSTAALPSAASNTFVTYVSTDAHGKRIVVSGTVAVPRGKPPEGGWPIISWAHGTTGYADVCAPTLGKGGMASERYLGEMRRFVDTWLSKGYAVVRTNYEGLGAPGGHPYMNGASAAHTVTDIVRAARELDSTLSENWIVMGHSQGGQAALFTAEKAPARAPELNLAGAVSIAPGGAAISDTVAYFRAGKPGARSLRAYLALIMLGAQAAEPSLHVKDMLTEAAQPLLNVARSGCGRAASSTTPVNVAPGELFASDADFAPLINYLNRQEPRVAVPSVPTMVLAGTDDKQVAKKRVDKLVRHYCQEGSTIRYQGYAGLNHSELLTQQAPRQDIARFVTRATGDQNVAGSCGAG